MNQLDLTDKKLFFFDLDGTIYINNQLIDGSIELFHQLNLKNIPYYFYTNNSSKDKSSYLLKLNSLGIIANENNIFTSSLDTIKWLTKNHIDKCYLLGTNLMMNEFRENSIEHTVKNPSMVVLGYDTTLTYEKITQVITLLNQDVPCIMTHSDLGCPSSGGILPDVGAFLAMFKAVKSFQPLKVFGKPTPDNVLHMMDKHNCHASEVVIIGDRLETDILMGVNAKVVTALVLSGVSKMSHVNQYDYSADHIIDSVGNIRI